MVVEVGVEPGQTHEVDAGTVLVGRFYTDRQ